MKKLLPLILTLLSASLLYGGVKIPKYVHSVKDIDKAQLEAKGKGKFLAFVYSDPNSTWGLCNTATEIALKKLRSVASVVFINSQKDSWSSLPKIVQFGLTHKDAGKYLPKTTITDAGLEYHVLSVRYESWKEESKTMRHIKKQLKESKLKLDDLKKKSAPKAPPFQTWTNAEGKKIKAQFVGLSGSDVTLKIPSGKKVSYPLDKLSESSQKLAKSLNEELNKTQ